MVHSTKRCNYVLCNHCLHTTRSMDLTLRWCGRVWQTQGWFALLFYVGNAPDGCLFSCLQTGPLPNLPLLIVTAVNS